MTVFHELLTSTRRRLALPPIPLRFFQALFDTFSPKQLHLVFALASDRPIAGALAISHGNAFHLEYAGELQDHRRTGVNQTLYWHFIQLAIRQGLKTFSFGRTEMTNAGLLTFKRHWRPTEERITHWQFGAPPLPTESYAHGFYVRKIARAVLQIAPKSLYNLAGSVLYRHWG